MSTIVLYKLCYIEYNNTHTKAIKHWQQRSKKHEKHQSKLHKLQR